MFHDPTFNIAQKCSLHIHSLFITVNIFNVRKSEKKIKKSCVSGNYALHLAWLGGVGYLLHNIISDKMSVFLTIWHIIPY